MEKIEQYRRYIEIVTGYRESYKLELDELTTTSRKLTVQESNRVVYILGRIRYADNTIGILEQVIAIIKMSLTA